MNRGSKIMIQTKSWVSCIVTALVVLYPVCCSAPLFNLPKFSHVTPLLCDLHWLPVAARIQFKMMVLAFKAVKGTAPVYLQTLVRPHTPTRALCSSTSAGWLVPPSLRANKAAQWSRDSSLFWHLSGGMNSRPMSGQQNHSSSPKKDSKLIC